jgi:putative hydrolases of HD superfamily
MQNDDLLKRLEFLREIDKLKTILRQSTVIDRSRRENSAEHSWHLALFALVLADYAAGKVDVGRVVQMLLIHDIVEVDAGDVPIHGPSDGKQAEREQQAAERLFGLLPGEKGQQYKALWEEFEAAKTDDARFAKALDRMQPVLNNIYTGGGTWVESHVSHERAVAVCRPPIQRGAPELWDLAEEWIGQLYEKGLPGRDQKVKE